MTKILEQIKNDVKRLMAGNNDGHGADHAERVCKLALRLAKEEAADANVVALACWLHDVDDYKLFGEESAQKLTNARRIMAAAGVSSAEQEQVCDIISSMGYSRALKGIRPQTLEGRIVSDADMLEATGAQGIVRCLVYALEHCNGCTDKLFDRNVFPELSLSAEEYKKPNRASDNFINHFFEKMLKLKNMMFTDAGRKEAEIRHGFMLAFLREFFREYDCAEWAKYLEEYEKNNQ